MFIILTHAAIGQYATDQLDLDGDIMSWYDDAIGDEKSPVLEGSYFKLEGVNAKENQYFQSTQWAKGSLNFSGQMFEQVELLYNSHRDLLIIKNKALHYSTTQPTLLNQSKVSAFRIYDRDFVNLSSVLTKGEGTGYYEILFEGSMIQFYAKRKKNEYVRSGKLVYTPEDKYYILYNNDFLRYTSKKLLYKLFPSFKEQIKNKSKVFSTRLKDDEGKDVSALMEYCNQLITEQ